MAASHPGRYTGAYERRIEKQSAEWAILGWPDCDRPPRTVQGDRSGDRPGPGGGAPGRRAAQNLGPGGHSDIRVGRLEAARGVIRSSARRTHYSPPGGRSDITIPAGASVKFRRRWLIAACVVGAVLALTAVPLAGWLLRPESLGVRFTRDQYDRVCLGMTPREVREAIGRPPGTYMRHSYPDPQVVAAESVTPPEWMTLQMRGESPEQTDETWIGESELIGVSYSSGRVWCKCYIVCDRSLAGHFRAWFEYFRQSVGL